MTETSSEESWWLEAAIAVVPGLPWYVAFTPWPVALIAHVVTLVVYLLLVRFVFGRGSAIMCGILVLIASVLVLFGVIAVRLLTKAA